MEINSKHSNSYEIGGLKQATANIQVSGKAFEILSSGIYTDKIGSIVREISSNAHDAHIAANKKDVPILIHIPTSEQSWFSVKDYGLGMSEEFMLEAYLNYFQSDKSNSNDQIGGFGLGCKSPFSYADSFTVKTSHNGIQSIYLLRKDIKRGPIIELLHRENSQEVGTEVIVPVHSSYDRSAFYKKIKETLCFFNPLPLIDETSYQIENFPSNVDVKEFFPSTDNVIFSVEGLYTYYRSLSTTTDSKFILGNVPYSIPPAFLSKFPILKDNNLNVYFNVGELVPTTSRESIEITNENTNAIANKIDQILEDIRTRFENTIMSISKRPKSEYQNINDINKFLATTKTLNQNYTDDIIRNLIDQKVIRNSIWVNLNEKKDYTIQYKKHLENKVHHYAAIDLDVVKYHKNPEDFNNIEEYNLSLEKWEKSVKELHNFFIVEPNFALDQLFIFVDEKKPPSSKRIRHHIEENFKCSYKDVSWFLIQTKLDNFEGVMSALGNPPLSLPSSALAKLPKKEVAERPRKLEKVSSAFELKIINKNPDAKYSNIAFDVLKKPTEYDFISNNHIFMVPKLKRNKYVFQDKLTITDVNYSNVIVTLINKAHLLGFLPKDCMVVFEHDEFGKQGKILRNYAQQNDIKIVNFFEYYKSEMNNFISNNTNLIKKIDEQSAIFSGMNSYFTTCLDSIGTSIDSYKNKELVKKSKLYGLVQMYIDHTWNNKDENGDPINKEEDALNWLKKSYDSVFYDSTSIYENTDVKFRTLKEIKEEIFAQTPMLKHITMFAQNYPYITSDSIIDIFDYVSLILKDEQQ